ncbi:hypothetical protein AGMMS49959_10360 [Planctomycetales bacterium]|nr:hypothetical protein AGMMS49959_10360 [Planctomycetales bacterium]
MGEGAVSSEQFSAVIYCRRLQRAKRGKRSIARRFNGGKTVDSEPIATREARQTFNSPPF